MIPPAPLPATEAISPRYRDLDAWAPAAMLQAMWEGQLAAVAAIGPALPAIAAAAEAALPRLRAGGRLVYAGAGTSGRVGVQDGAELPPTFDWPETRLVLLMAGGEAAFTRAIENAEDDAPAGTAAVVHHDVDARDVVIGIAASGTTPFTIAVLREAAARGALTIAVANSPGGALLAAAAHPILVETAPEIIAGSTRMKAGTAQKIVLNLLSTQVMIRLGRVHQGLMVDMLARNAKLRERAVRMLHHLAGAEPEAARAALEATGGRVKPAVLVLRGLAAEAAEALLARHGGSLRDALAELTARPG
ncbi:MAG: N-acetylmuramic acid 6-phosphate etherase [Rhodospirillales bacterium]|nr:N-acetylmuramic acid 6-phosphate etherase [Rhodospirillales bacterium]MDE2575867.1 N-acetylmuramic acid 6-phosphate etherase [Rhodospirillales bacterium]